MKNAGLLIRQPKARGEWAELRFMTRAAELGLRVSKPWGENAPYDFAVDHRGRFLRVQVKCTCKKRSNSYVCSVTSNRGPYSAAEIDFIAALIIPADTWYILPIAALIIPADTWYILPIAALRRSFDVWLAPHRPHSRYAKFQEAWYLLKR
jgi:hypothetical protein